MTVRLEDGYGKYEDRECRMEHVLPVLITHNGRFYVSTGEFACHIPQQNEIDVVKRGDSKPVIKPIPVYRERVPVSVV